MNSDGITALHLAVSLGWSEGVEELLLNGADADILPSVKQNNWPWHEIPIFTACRNGDYAIAYRLLERKPDLSYPNFDGNYVIHLAAYAHNYDLIDLLLQEKIVKENISTQNEKGNTPLHLLMMANNANLYEEEIVECTKLLLQHGADIDAVNSLGKTPLILAARANLPLAVAFLMESRANVLMASNDGRNVLHAACRSGSHESLAHILQYSQAKRLVLHTDKKGLAPFHLAVSSCSASCCEILLQNGDHLTTEDSYGRTRCSLVLKNMPSASQLLKKVFDNHTILSDVDTNDPEYNIQMDFNVILSKSNEDVEASLIAELSSSDSEALLKHPLIESFLYLKWHKIKYFFFLYVLGYFIFLVVHTTYIVMTFNMKINWRTHTKSLTTIHWLHASLLLILLIPGMIVIMINVKKYIKHWETYFKIIALFSASFVVFTQGSTMFSVEVSRNVAAASIFFTWVEFMMLLGRLPSLGVYILMFTKVSKSVLRFLLAFSPLFLAFALSFSILLQKVEPFNHFPAVFVRTLMMMIGEIEFSDIYATTMTEGKITMVVTQIFLVVFVILIPILMTNLLIGLAVSDLPDLQLQGKIRRLVKEASYLESYERILLFFKNILPLYITETISCKGSITRKITIWPNQRHKKESVSVPPDAITEAKVIGTVEDTLKPLDLKSTFKNFYIEYQNDRERFEGALETLYDTLLHHINQSSGDSADGKRTRKLRIKTSLLGHKIRRRYNLFVHK